MLSVYKNNLFLIVFLLIVGSKIIFAVNNPKIVPPITQEKPWLDNVWVLEEIHGTKVSQNSNSEEKLNLKIRTESSSFSGFLGCNRMGGKIYVENDQIKFKNVTATRMSCENSQTEMAFINGLLTVTSYGVIEDRLYLSNEQGIQFVLIRS